MYKSLQRQIAAVRFNELVSRSPLVLVYQIYGQTDANTIKNALEADAKKRLPECPVEVVSMRLPNCVVSASGDQELSSLFSCSNVVVGWATKPTQPQSGKDVIKSENKIPQLLQWKAGGGRGIDQFHQPIIKAVLEASFKICDKQPLLLLGCLHEGHSLALQDVREWMKLDASQVYVNLLSQLEAAPEAMCDLDNVLDELVECVDGATPEGLLMALDHLAEGRAKGSDSP